MGACLSLSGRFAAFGRQAALALRAWQATKDNQLQVIIEDDASDPSRVSGCLRRLAASCDFLLGPYSSTLTRAAARLLPELDCLLWNHGGAADDVQTACPGRIVSVLTPARGYAEPFVRWLAGSTSPARLEVVSGSGAFAQSVARGAETLVRAAGWDARSVTLRPGHEASWPDPSGGGIWDLFCVGSFEDDVATAARARALPNPPRAICAVAAGTWGFGSAIGHPAGIYGIAQWVAGDRRAPTLGPSGRDFIRAYSALTPEPPDYPAAQAYAAALLATHCAQLCESVHPEALWAAAAALTARTFFGDFAIDPITGAQVGHETVLTIWTPAGLSAVAAEPPA